MFFKYVLVWIPCRGSRASCHKIIVFWILGGHACTLSECVKGSHNSPSVFSKTSCILTHLSASFCTESQHYSPEAHGAFFWAAVWLLGTSSYPQVAVTSEERANELQALRGRTPYTFFHRDTVMLRQHPKFISEVVSEFHLNQSVNLPVLFLKPHSTQGEKQHTLDHLHLFVGLCDILDKSNVFPPAIR